MVVFDAANLHAESAFWAGMLGGYVFAGETWHSVFDAAGDWRVYADPAGHPFCIGWGHPSRAALAAFVADRLGRGDLDPDA